jgi:hypothetical protein
MQFTYKYSYRLLGLGIRTSELQDFCLFLITLPLSRKGSKETCLIDQPTGAHPTIARYNASAVKIYSATSSRFEN